MKRRILKSIALFSTVAMIIGLAGCGSSNAASVATSAATSTATSSSKSGAIDPWSDPIKVAYVPMTLSSVNGTEWGVAAKDELSMYSNITFNTFDGNSSAEKQNEILNELIVQGYNAVILQAADSAAIASSVTRCEQAGIKVITMNIPVSVPHSGHMQAPNIESGILTAEAVGEELGGKGTAALIDVPANMAAAVLMGQGFKDTLAEKYPDIKLVADQAGDWSTEQGNSITRDYLSKYPDLGAIFTSGDAAAIGAMQAAEAAGRSDLIIWGCDGSKECLQYIEEGKITGTIYVDYDDMGRAAAREAMYAISTGIDGSTYASTPVTKITPIVVTKDNVDTIPEDKRF